MIASFVTSVYLFGIPQRILAWKAPGLAALFPLPEVVKPGTPNADAWLMLITVDVSTTVWTSVTFLTRPETNEVLDSFYRRVRPGGPGWAQVSERLGFGRERIPGGALAWTNWLAGIIAVYGTLFGIGKVVFGEMLAGAVLLAIAAAAFAWIARSFRMDHPDPAGAINPPSEALAAD